MKKLIRFLLVLALGAFLGYVFHNPIDNKLRGWFGDENVDNAVAKTEELGEKSGKALKGAYEGAKDSIQNKEE